VEYKSYSPFAQYLGSREDGGLPCMKPGDVTHRVFWGQDRACWQVVGLSEAFDGGQAVVVIPSVKPIHAARARLAVSASARLKRDGSWSIWRSLRRRRIEFQHMDPHGRTWCVFPTAPSSYCDPSAGRTGNTPECPPSTSRRREPQPTVARQRAEQVDEMRIGREPCILLPGKHARQHPEGSRANGGS
jgi:hypothetical protein